MLGLLLAAMIANPVPVAYSDFPTEPPSLECYDYDLFVDVVEKSGGKLTQTIETPSFPTFKRLMVVTLAGTKLVFGAYDDCVLVPPLFIDYPDGMKVVPRIEVLPPKKPADPVT